MHEWTLLCKCAQFKWQWFTDIYIGFANQQNKEICLKLYKYKYNTHLSRKILEICLSKVYIPC